MGSLHTVNSSRWEQAHNSLEDFNASAEKRQIIVLTCISGKIDFS